MIEIHSLVKSYDGFRAADGVTFRVEPGEIVGLVGPNGAGKTTTLRCLTGIIPPTEGRIVVAGHDLEADGVEAKRCLAFVPDEPHLFDHLTSWDYLMLVGRLCQQSSRRNDALSTSTVPANLPKFIQCLPPDPLPPLSKLL